MKKPLIISVALLLLFFFSGCANPQKTAQVPALPSYSVNYTAASGLENYEIIDCKCFNNNICSIGIRLVSEEETLYDYYYLQNDFEGNLTNCIKFAGATEIYVENYCELPNGNILIAFDKFDENDEYISTAIICDKTGTIISENATALDGLINSSSYICPLPSDNFLLQYGNNLLLFNSLFEINLKVVIPEDCKIVSSYDNKVYALYKENKIDYIAQLDANKLTFVNPIECPVSYDTPGIKYCSGKYIFLINDNKNLYGYSPENGVETILNFFDCGIASGYGLDFWVVENENVIKSIEFYNVEFQKVTINIADFKKRNNDIRTEITVGLQKRYGKFWETALLFNQRNDEYKVKIIDYTEFITTDNPHGDREKMLLDLATGNGPDVFIFGDPNLVELLKRKKVLLALDDYIEQDEEINRSDYFPNIIDAGSYNNKLMAFIPNISLATMITSAEDGEHFPEWTTDCFEKYISASSNGPEILYSASRYDVLIFLIYANESIFDGETCNFVNEDFYSALKAASSFPAYDGPIPYDVDREITLFRNGQCKIEYADIDWVGGYGYYKDIIFGKPISLIGLPSTKFGKNLLRYDEAFAISAKSQNKDGAWQFVRQFMLPDYLEPENGPLSTYIPLFFEKAKNVKMPVWYLSDGGELRATPLSDDEVNMLYDTILSAQNIMYSNPDIEAIITEEAEAYFAGEKEAKEVAKIIQSRISVYLKENK